MTDPRLIVSRRLPPDVEARATAGFDAVLNPADRPLDDSGWASADADALLVTVTDRPRASRRCAVSSPISASARATSTWMRRARAAWWSPTPPTC